MTAGFTFSIGLRWPPALVVELAPIEAAEDDGEMIGHAADRVIDVEECDGPGSEGSGTFVNRLGFAPVTERK